MSTDCVCFWKSIHAFKEYTFFVWIYSQLQIHTMLYVNNLYANSCSRWKSIIWSLCCLRSPSGHGARSITLFAVYKRHRWRSKLKHKVVCWWLYPILANQSQEVADGLQHNLDTVVEWSHRYMSFNPKKCSVLKTTQKKQPLFHQYLMCAEEITHIDQQTYLGD